MYNTLYIMHNRDRRDRDRREKILIM